ncbi:MAG: tRNA (adenosine(37)-N6)-threonylcarbamoyltransferase complex dimerization subunit type 1 TsaB [Thermoanaerobaculia bacterium]
MLILAADTSLSTLSTALLRDGTLIGAVALEGKSSRNEKLLPAIDWLLGESAVDRKEIDLFAVTRGPGSFTGVRIGLATVQGLALALGKPVCALSTHHALVPQAGRWAVIDDAGRGQLYVSVFEDGREVLAPRLASPSEAETLGAHVVVSEFIQHTNVALECARKAARIEAAGELALFADITPIYGRLAEADVKLREQKP